MNLKENLFNKLKKNQAFAWLIIIAGFALTSCKANYQPTDAKITVDEKGWQVYDPAMFEEQPVVKKQTQNVIVLFHGLNAHDAEEMRELAQKLNNDFSDATVINLNRYNSAAHTINEQVRETYRALKEKLGQYNVKHHLIPNVILIGDSQGGVLALEIFRAYKQKCIKNASKPSKNHLKIKIVGIITHHSPLEGANLIQDNTLNGLTNVLNNPLTRLTIGGLANSGFLNNTATFLSTVGDQLAKYAKAGGVQDLDPNSECIIHVQNTLERTNIPILAIGGTVEPLEGVHAMAVKTTNNNPTFTLGDLNLTANRVKLIGINLPGQINRMITGSSEGEHDGLIPLSSQLAAHTYAPKLERLRTTGSQHHWVLVTSPETYSHICNHIKAWFNQ